MTRRVRERRVRQANVRRRPGLAVLVAALLLTPPFGAGCTTSTSREQAPALAPAPDNPPDAPAAAPTDDDAALAPNGVLFSSALLFDTPAGGSAPFDAGLYVLEAADDRLRIRGDAGPGTVVASVRGAHAEAIDAPTALVVVDASGVHAMLLLPGGRRLEALGFADGIRPAGGPMLRVSQAVVSRQLAASQVGRMVVLSPDTTSRWPTGATRPIRWGRYGQLDTTTRIDLVRDDGALRRLAGAAPNSGTYTWRVPPLPPGRYRVLVTTNDGAVRATSAEFTIAPRVVMAQAPGAHRARPSDPAMPTPPRRKNVPTFDHAWLVEQESGVWVRLFGLRHFEFVADRSFAFRLAPGHRVQLNGVDGQLCTRNAEAGAFFLQCRVPDFEPGNGTTVAIRTTSPVGVSERSTRGWRCDRPRIFGVTRRGIRSFDVVGEHFEPGHPDARVVVSAVEVLDDATVGPLPIRTTPHGDRFEVEVLHPNLSGKTIELRAEIEGFTGARSTTGYCLVEDGETTMRTVGGATLDAQRITLAGPEPTAVLRLEELETTTVAGGQRVAVPEAIPLQVGALYSQPFQLENGSPTPIHDIQLTVTPDPAIRIPHPGQLRLLGDPSGDPILCARDDVGRQQCVVPLLAPGQSRLAHFGLLPVEAAATVRLEIGAKGAETTQQFRTLTRATALDLDETADGVAVFASFRSGFAPSARYDEAAFEAANHTAVIGLRNDGPAAIPAGALVQLLTDQAEATTAQTRFVVRSIPQACTLRLDPRGDPPGTPPGYFLADCVLTEPLPPGQTALFSFSFGLSRAFATPPIEDLPRALRFQVRSFNEVGGTRLYPDPDASNDASLDPRAVLCPGQWRRLAGDASRVECR